ncbi:hypothetical protein [Micromonospora sp. RTP1Z1]|uniref:hypothetical protein n=1 Tax=Micromonospora sp. RTP1Z1 TaxID=2994043 RepID=UPI0029C87E1C|nr:hypothetical protein [Micromonospora sp. RTP1Z1]
MRPATAPPAPEFRVVLPLPRCRIGRRSLWRLLHKARLRRLHWISITVDPSRGGRVRYEAAASRGDVLPPGATWTPMAVTCDVVGGRAFRALVADGHTSIDDGAVLARFPRYAAQLMATHLDGLRLGDMPGEHPMLRFDADTVVVEWEHDEFAFTRRIECDRINPDANGCYAIGAYQWPWTPLPIPDSGTRREDAATGQTHPLPPAAVARYADLILAEIDDDIAESVVPAGVRSFADLHRYVDANDYLIAAGVPHDATPTTIEVTVDVQNEVTARLRTPDRPFCTCDTCAFPAHDHATYTGRDGEDLDVAAPMRCHHCGQPAHYDERLQDYRHDDPSTPDCFLIRRDT